jgi:hypothetical protein
MTFLQDWRAVGIHHRSIELPDGSPPTGASVSRMSRMRQKKLIA